MNRSMLFKGWEEKSVDLETILLRIHPQDWVSIADRLGMSNEAVTGLASKAATKALADNPPDSADPAGRKYRLLKAGLAERDRLFADIGKVAA